LRCVPRGTRRHASSGTLFTINRIPCCQTETKSFSTAMGLCVFPGFDNHEGSWFPAPCASASPAMRWDRPRCCRAHGHGSTSTTAAAEPLAARASTSALRPFLSHEEVAGRLGAEPGRRGVMACPNPGMGRGTPCSGPRRVFVRHAKKIAGPWPRCSASSPRPMDRQVRWRRIISAGRSRYGWKAPRSRSAASSISFCAEGAWADRRPGRVIVSAAGPAADRATPARGRRRWRP
jgi:hypothetical protein